MKKFITIVIVISLSIAEVMSQANNLGNCTINGLTHNYLAITDPIYDTDAKTTVPYSYKLATENVRYIYSPASISTSMDSNKYLSISINKQDETTILNEKSDYNLKFVLRLQCNDGTTVNMNTVVPFVDSNNHEPFFSKPEYIYNLISTFEEDFKRLLELNPITATDYDVTNQELLFNIEDNTYFDIVYGGVIPGTLNKKHFAQLVPKLPGQIITKKIEVALTVTDLGNPPISNTSKLVINPPSPPAPVFNKPFYVGHLYKNYSFEVSENPQLQEGVTYYTTKVEVLKSDEKDCAIFSVSINEGQIIIEKYPYFTPSDFYERNYVACPLRATYEDSVTKLYSSGNSTVIVEFHHDL